MTSFVRKCKIWGIELIAFMLISFNSFATNVFFNLNESPGFNAVPGTNRQITINAFSPFPGNTIFLPLTDTNGCATNYNTAVGLYNFQIKAPPGLIQGRFYVTLANLGTDD